MDQIEAVRPPLENCGVNEIPLQTKISIIAEVLDPKLDGQSCLTGYSPELLAAVVEDFVNTLDQTKKPTPAAATSTWDEVCSAPLGCLGPALEHEHPQIAALLLASLPTENARVLIRNMRNAVARRSVVKLRDTPKLPPARLELIAQALSNSFAPPA